jgi:CelD/BcsL family acetyltransferase involved in cellulose biosynthesis
MTPLAPGKWHLKPASSFLNYAELWDRLNRESFDHILLDSRFVDALLGHFGDSAVKLALWNQGGDSVLALIRPSSCWSWTTFQPSQAPLGLIVGRFPFAATKEPVRSLLSSTSRVTLQFSILQQDPVCSTFTAPGDSVDYIQTPRLTIQGTFEQYWKGRSGNLRHNLRRQRKRLSEENHELGLERLQSPSDMRSAVEAHARLESTGWKAELGTEIGADNAQGRFYEEILRRLASSSETVVYQLTLDRTVIASDLCLRRGSMLVILKTAYDQSLNGLSPGLLLHQAIIEDLFAGGEIGVVEFYGRTLEWHRKFTEESRQMFHVNIYRNEQLQWLSRLLRGLR